MKKVVRILLAILMVTVLVLGITACKSECEKGNHVWDEGTVTTTATCTSKGVRTFKCTVCDETRTETIDMIDHTPIDASVPATCTTAGTTGATKCSVCGTSIAAGTTIPAKGHDVTTWTPCENDETKHEGICTREGCGVKVTEAHTPNEAGTECTRCHATLGGELPHNHNFDETIVANVTIVRDPDCTEKGSKTVKCSGCDEVKTVEIPALGHDYTGVDWAPSTQVAGKHFRTCTREGCGYIERADHTPEVVKGTPATCTEAGIKDGSKCSACNAVLTVGETINPLGHTWQTAWQSNDEQHWHKCVRCDATSTKQNHDFGENDHDLVCTVCDTNRPGENYVLTYEIDGQEVQQSYQRLADAVAFIAENQEVNNVIINVNDNDKELEGLGVAIPSGLTITINLHGSTYIIVSDPVGSTGTETNGFQILAGSNITIQNGTITSQAGSGVKMLIQNYANLKLDGVTLDGRNLDLASNAPNYTLSNNCGTVDIRNQSKIIAREENGVALDVWYNMGGRYPEGVSVTVGKTCTITGAIEYGSAQEGANLKDNATLSLPAGTYNQLRFTSNVTSCIDTGITIDNKALTANWGEWTTVKDHEPTCENEGLAERFCKLCGLRDTKPLAKTSHTMDTAEYVGEHQHTGTCTVCGFEGTADCTIVNDVCTVCEHELYVVRNRPVNIDFTSQGWTSGSAVTGVTVNNVQVKLENGSGNNAPVYNNNKADSIRLYYGNVMTITVPQGWTITKITINFDSTETDMNTISVESGLLKNGVWTGESNSVEFTIGKNANNETKGHRRIESLSVEITSKVCNHFFDYNNGKITTKPGCTTDGEITYTCMDCGDATETETIPASHKLGELVPAENPDCENEEPGHVAYYQCKECGKYFEDAKATTEILEKDIDIKWEHDFEVIPEVEATVDSKGKQSYNHCKVCGKNYELDGTTPITDLESWGEITYDCEHATHVWKLLNGQHVYVCSTCGKDQQKAHNPKNGTWSTAVNEEGTEVHTLSCGGHADCPYTIATHNADYSDDYTVAEDGDHVQACGGANCTLVKTDTKHTAALGNLIPTQDGTQHHQVCGHEGCNYATTPVGHEITIAYIGGGKHGGTCVCGKTVEADCNSNDDDNACTECGRIVGIVDLEENIVFASLGYSDAADVTSKTIGYITFVFSDGSKYYDSGAAVRLYKNGTLTINANNGSRITKIIFTFVSKSYNNLGYVSGGGSLSTNNATATWQNDEGSNIINFKNANTDNTQVRIVSIEITYSLVCHHEGENVLVHKTVTPATCESAGIKKDCYYCTVCDKYFTTEDCTAIVTKANAVAQATGHTYGNLIEARSATCEREEYKIDHYHCEACGKYFNASKEAVDEDAVIGLIATHTWGEWTNNNNGTHTRTCSFGVHIENGTCTYDENMWEYDESGHWHACPLCGYIFDEGFGEHVGMNDGVCDTCPYSSTAVTVSVSVDGGAESLVRHTLPKQAEIGTQITFTVSVEDGYRVVSVEDFVADVKIDAVKGTYTYTFTEGSVDSGEVTVLIAIIKQVTVNLSVENGTITATYGEGDNATTVTSGDKVDVGTTLTITVSPSQGYQVKAVTVTGRANPLTATNGKYTYDISKDITDNSITISAATVEVKAEKSATYQFGTSDTSATGEISVANLKSKFTSALKSGDTNVVSSVSKSLVYSSTANTDNLKLGSKNSCGNLTLTFDSTVKVTKIVITAKTYSSDSSAINVNNENSKSLGSNAEEYTFELNGEESVKINITGKRGYIDSIVVYYEEA